MNPRTRQVLIALVAAALAILMGVQIADGELLLPVLASLAGMTALMVRMLGLPVDVILIGWTLIGYIVGNRGFAQLTPVQGLPLLPAEICLLVALPWRIISGGLERRLPWQKDPLNVVLGIWLIIGIARLGFDLRTYGLLAVRDSAMVYYALFFFVAQDIARDERARRYLFGCLLVGGLVLVPTYLLTLAFPDIFMQHLTVRGAPLIYHKGDLLATFAGVTSLILFHWAKGRQRYWAQPLSVLMIVWVLSGDNRASAVGLLLACGLLLLAGHWRFPLTLFTAMFCGLSLLLGLATLGDNVWADRELDGLHDRAASITNQPGERRVHHGERGMKEDNNAFRWTWWRTTANDTLATNPAFGLGFGYDLARNFLQEYNPDMAEDFTARSPHNMAVTALGRMGLVGLGAWLIVMFVILTRCWHSLRYSTDPASWGLQASLCLVLVSACFGVVLEGPMGAMPFWVILGLIQPRADAPKSDEQAHSP